MAETTMLSHSKLEIDATFEHLLERVSAYRPEADLDLLRRAYDFSYKVHDGQLRQSGEPYVLHPLSACHILADIEADEQALAACLLHDCVEDCAQDEEREIKRLQRERSELPAGRRRQAEELDNQILGLAGIVEKVKDEVGQLLRDEFGPVVSDLVDGVTRLSEMRFYEIQGVRPKAGESTDGQAARNEEFRQLLQAENLRRMVVAAAQDVRVLIIKLADRLHNMQTLYAKKRTKQIKIARETEVIYAKLADRLGIWRIKWEMEDLAFRYLEPDAYYQIERRVAKTRDQRMEEINQVIDQICAALEAEDVRAQVYGRPKHLYSIWTKMRQQGLNFDEIYDLEAVRIITDTSWHCYKVLYIVHGLWPHQPEQFADYISNPKSNGYKCIHTKVIVPGHGPMEVQIRSEEMHREAEYGAAAHWRYKSEGIVDERFSHKLTTLRQLFEMARSSGPMGLSEDVDAGDDEAADDEAEAVRAERFVRQLQASLSEEDIFVYTPKGEVIDLPKGATPIDFAYRIHSQIGHTCIGARVNRRMVPLDYELHSGDQVEILRQRNTGPSRDWLRIVRTPGARNRIRQYFRQKERSSLIDEGQRLLEEAAAHLKVDLNELHRRDRELPQAFRRRSKDEPVEDLLTRVALRRNYRSDDDLLTAVGDRLISAEGVVKQMLADLEEACLAAGLRAPVEVEPVTPLGEPSTVAAASLQGLSNLSLRRSKCCLPIPGEAIVGYVTRGTGIAIHRADCANVRYLGEKEPGRVRVLDWSKADQVLYDVPLELWATPRRDLLVDLAQLMADLGANILKTSTSAPTGSRAGANHLTTVRMAVELVDRPQLDQLLRRLPSLGVVRVTVRGQVYLDIEKGSRQRGTRKRPPARRD